MRRSVWATVGKLLVLVALSVAPSSLWADPCIRLTFAPFHDLDKMLVYATEIGRSPAKAQDAHEALKKMGLGDGAGLDTSKRWGAFVDIQATNQPPTIGALLPVKDEAAFLAALKPFFPQQERLPDGRTKVQGEKTPPLAIRFAESYAHVTVATPTEFPPLKEPGKLLDGQGTLELVVAFGANGDQTKKALVELMKSLTLTKVRQKTYANDAEKLEAIAKAEQSMQALEKSLASVERFNWALDLSPDKHQFSTAVEVKKKAEPEAKGAAAPIGLSGMAAASSPLGIAANLVFDTGYAGPMQTLIAGYTEGLKRNSRKENDKNLAASIEAEIDAIMKSMRLEAMAFVDGKRGEANGVAAFRLSKNSTLGPALLAKAKAASEDGKKSKVTSTSFEGIRVDTYVNTEAKDSLAKNLGAAEVSLGVGPQVLWAAIGPKSAERIKALAIGLGKAKAGGTSDGTGNIKGWFAILSLVEIFGEGDLAPDGKDRAAFNDMMKAGADKVEFTMTRSAVNISIQEAPLAAMLKGMFTATPVAPVPDGSATPGQEGSPAAASPVEASPTPKASAAAGSESKGEGKEKGEGEGK